ncbi:DUF935 domain-containing protein [Rhizobium herbae]
MALSPILDASGQPIVKAALTKEQGGVTTRGVRQPFGRHQAPGLTPGKLARILRQSIDGDAEAYLELAEDMEERDLHYAGVLSIRKRQVAGLQIDVEAAGVDAESIRDADLVREVISRDNFEDELIDILDAIGKSYSATEIIWDKSEGRWMPEALKYRDPRWFIFDVNDGDTLQLRGENGMPEALLRFKWIVHRAKVKSGLTIRGGLARSIAWTFLFKSFTAKDWAIFCEAYGQPLRVGKFGPDASPEDKNVLLNAVASIGTDFAAIIPASMSIEFVQASISGSHELYEKRQDWLDRQTSKIVLGQTATTDAQAGGFAVGKVHDGVRADIERSDAKQLAATLNRDLVRPLIDLNHGRRKSYPKITIGRAEEVDIEKLVKNVSTLVPLGLKVGMATMRDKIGIPDPDKNEELLIPSPQAAQAALPAPGAPVAKSPVPKLKLVTQSAQPIAVMPYRDAIDDAAEAIIASEWEQMVSPIVVDLPAKLAAATSPGEVKEILIEAGRTMDVGTMVERLAQLTFSARISGEANEDIA